MKKISFILLSLMIISCGREQDEPQTQNPNIENKKSASLNIQEEVKVALLPQAEAELRHWTAFINSQQAIEQVKNYDKLEQIQLYKETLVEIINELHGTVPSSFKVPPVESRLNVLYTKSLILNQQLQTRNKNVDLINETLNEIISEFEFLKIQLNELFLKSPESFEIDLEEIQKKEDSINLELEDFQLSDQDPFLGMDDGQ